MWLESPSDGNGIDHFIASFVFGFYKGISTQGLSNSIIEFEFLQFPSHFLRYLKEDKPHGSAGGLYHFRDLIMEDDPVRNQLYLYY